MAYLRLIANKSLKRRARRDCVGCHRAVFTFEAFCPFCGTQNEHLSETTFMAAKSVRVFCLSFLDNNLE